MSIPTLAQVTAEESPAENQRSYRIHENLFFMENSREQ